MKLEGVVPVVPISATEDSTTYKFNVPTDTNPTVYKICFCHRAALCQKPQDFLADVRKFGGT